jgi:putative endopeptidase
VRTMTEALTRSALALFMGLALAHAPTSAPLRAAEPQVPLSFPGGIDKAGMDRAVAPGDDFFAYANGGWLKTAVIPPDQSSAGIFDKVVDLTDARVEGLIQEAVAKPAPEGSELHKVADFYSAYMDEAAIEARGLAPLQPALERIAKISDRRTLSAALGGTLRADVDVLNSAKLHTPNVFGLWVAQDLNDPSKYSPFLLQGGLGLPSREYYLSPSPEMVKICEAYRAHIAATLRLAHVADPDAKAARILGLEKAIAKVHWTRAEAWDVRKGNNHWSRKDFPARAPGMDWTAYFEAAGLGRQETFAVWQPSAVTGISALVSSVPLETWKDYLVFRVLDHAAPVLPKAFLEEGFAFYGRTLSGTPELQPRWRLAVDATNGALGDAVGKLYVAKYFPPSEKVRAQAMVHNIIAAYGKRIDALPWMAASTKARAKAKLATLKVSVGYPDKWIDYSALAVDRADAFGNAERVEKFDLARALGKLGTPVDRDEWVMTPQTVNAVNLPVMNAMNFPAAILQPPFFDPSRPEVIDYGMTGATIGHEISHSFDDQGSLFDERGKLDNWWTDQDLAHFKAASALLVKQFDAYRPFPDLTVNGKVTLGENIADVAGLAAAYDAYRLSLGGKEVPAAEGFTRDQLFFLGYCQSWREKAREAALRQQVLTDGHAPAEYRADSVRNLDTWYGAFDVKPGQKLYLAPADRVKIW